MYHYRTLECSIDIENSVLLTFYCLQIGTKVVWIILNLLYLNFAFIYLGLLFELLFVNSSAWQRLHAYLKKTAPSEKLKMQLICFHQMIKNLQYYITTWFYITYLLSMSKLLD